MKKMLTYKGETLTMAEWSRRTGLSADALRGRIRKGWSVERALTESRDEARVRARTIQEFQSVRSGRLDEVPPRNWMTGL
jgi:hypothetical protein